MRHGPRRVSWKSWKPQKTFRRRKKKTEGSQRLFEKRDGSERECRCQGRKDDNTRTVSRRQNLEAGGGGGKRDFSNETRKRMASYGARETPERGSTGKGLWQKIWPLPDSNRDVPKRVCRESG